MIRCPGGEGSPSDRLGLARPGQELGHGGAESHPIALGGGGLEESPVEAFVVGADHEGSPQGPGGTVRPTGSHQCERGTERRVDDEALEGGLGAIEHGPVRPTQAGQQGTAHEGERTAETVRVPVRGQSGEPFDVGGDVVGKPEGPTSREAGSARRVGAQGSPGIGGGGVDRRR